MNKIKAFPKVIVRETIRDFKSRNWKMIITSFPVLFVFASIMGVISWYLQTNYPIYSMSVAQLEEYSEAYCQVMHK